jgi:hypothetical protein
MCLEVYSQAARPASKLEVSASISFYEIWQADELQGKTVSKFLANAGFPCNEAPVIATMFRDMTTCTQCIFCP